GITGSGRFGAVTNIRAPQEKRVNAPTRGALVADYLTGKKPAAEYIAGIVDRNDEYNGFNLIIGDAKQLIWFSNRAEGDARNGRPLPPGIYGLSNALLDTPWPKVVRAKAQFSSLLCQGAPEAAYFEMLSDTARAPDCRLPQTGIGLEMERVLSAVCIESPNYGTRASTVVQLDRAGGAMLHEQMIR
ncbi:MAG TPA: NRDE family protein, partial [Burkholderiaceae bacterium]|nr:NRDE family protein [Burkholderiaceae bacterium]